MNQVGLISAIRMTGHEKPIEEGWNDINKWHTEDGLLWIHLDYKSKESHRWLHLKSRLDTSVLEALLAEDTRPRFFIHGPGLLIIMRGINLNPGSEPDDMVSLRVWIEPGRIISMRHRKVMAVDDLRMEILNGEGPKTEGDFLAQLTRKLSLRMAESLDNLSERVDELEELVFGQQDKPLRTVISELRRQIIGLRRYLIPQKDVFERIQIEKIAWITPADQAILRETSDRLTRYVEDLNAARERTAVVQDELESQMASRMNQTMYLLSIVTAIFLPLGLFTGLLGINVGGIPGTENPHAFLFVCSFLTGIAILQFLIFRRIRWI
ncbi:MAG: zinc transporter ZntB [Desulfuromonas sp.]|nr:MAG: zinc transporter ZntB [Desulfuromonas sp.]